MLNKGDNTIGSGAEERAGIDVRDLTRSGRPARLKGFNFDRLARALVFVSLGLGLMEALAPKRVQKVVPFPMACGNCAACQAGLYALCENSNPNAWMAEKFMGYSPAGIFGYSHMLGGFAGGQAEYARVPFADVGPLKVPDGMTDEQALFLSDIFPTGYMGAEMCNIQPGQTIAIWGCGPVGQFAIRSAFMLGAGRVIAIDHIPERMRMAQASGAEVLSFDEVNVFEALKEMTAGRGPEYLYDKTMQAMRMEFDRLIALRDAILACKNGGIVSVIGVYGGFIDKFPMGTVVNRGLTIRAGQCHVQRYMRPLLERIERGEIDPSFVITHKMKLDQAPEGYKIFRDKQDECIKIVLYPQA